MSVIFCSQDVERVLGLQQVLADLSVICINRNSLSNHLQKKVKNLFCLEDYEPVKDAISTADLLNHSLVQRFIKKVSGSQKPNILVFKNIPKVEKLAQKHGWNLLNNSAAFNQIFEDKINFVKECQLAGIQIPASTQAKLSADLYDNLVKQIGKKLVVQFRRGHAGETTYFVNSKTDWQKLVSQKPDFPARVSAFIEGKTFTYNICITKKQTIYSNLMFQITGQKPFTVHAGGTCGVDSAFASNFKKHEKKIQIVLSKFTELLKKQGYNGFLGVDFLLENKTNNVYLIECNPRLTANISLNTQLEILQGNKPLIQSHLEAFLPTLKFKKSSASDKLTGASYFVLRNNTNLAVQLKTHLKSGKYRVLKNGKTEYVNDDFQLKNCTSDEFILHLEGAKTIVSPNAKVASITAPFSVLALTKTPSPGSTTFKDDTTVKPFVQAIFEQIGFKTIFVHPCDFWPQTYGKPAKLITEVYRKPLKNVSQLSDKAKNRNRQTQLLKSEGTIQLLGEYEDFYLIKKWDNTLGWVVKKDLAKADEAVEKPKLQLGKMPIKAAKKPTHKPAKKPTHKPAKKPSNAQVQAFFTQYKHTPYLWGGLSAKGIDCSGLVQRYFLELFNFGLPKHTADQMKYGKLVKSQKNLKNHDLVFLTNRATKTPHVGIFFEGKIHHSCLSKNKVLSQTLAEIEANYNVFQNRRLFNLHL